MPGVFWGDGRAWLDCAPSALMPKRKDLSGLPKISERVQGDEMPRPDLNRDPAGP